MNAPQVHFELGALKGEADPYAVYARAREDGPVQRSGDSWLVFGHVEAAQLLRSSSTRTGFMAQGFRSRLPEGAAREEMSNRINFIDPPRHTQVRKLVGMAFTPRRTRRLEPFIRDVARQLLAPLAGDEPVDLIRSYAHEVPSLVISELLGVPVEDRDRLTALADRVSKLLGTGNTEAELADAISGAEVMHATFRSLIEDRRNEPQDDLLSALLEAEEGDQRLTESELLSLAATLYSAGHRTTRDLFTNGLTALLKEPEIIASLQDGSLPTEAVVEEFLRFETPTHMVARILEEPLELGGYEVPAGRPIAVMLAAANRDPRVYPDGDRFDPWRWTRTPEPAAPLSFALGAHFCLGASLARLEASTMLKALLDEFPEIRLSDASLKWHHTGVFRGVDELPVVLGPRAEPRDSDAGLP
ncbi:MAG: cytochrome P450 [Myxococcota bacterium]|jgi:cytochrome P450|nr:cytochrome P450 [Myxococcota bacterium]